MTTETTTCPCCQRRVHPRRMRQTFALFPFDGMMLASGAGLAESFIEILRRYYRFYQWACDDCLNGRRALRADPQKQFYTFKYPWDVAQPYLAYYDQDHICEECGEAFTFTKEEQRHWYEELRFVVYSVPIRCKACGYPRKLNKELSRLLRDGLPDDLDTLYRIADIYAELGKPEKQKAYLAEARKREARL